MSTNIGAAPSSSDLEAQVMEMEKFRCLEKPWLSDRLDSAQDVRPLSDARADLLNLVSGTKDFLQLHARGFPFETCQAVESLYMIRICTYACDGVRRCGA